MTKRSRQRAEAQQTAAAPPELAEPPGFFDDPTVRRWLPVLGIILLAFVAMFPSLNGMYIWDDDQWLTHNGLILDQGHFWRIWFDPFATPHYYPLVFTTFWVEYRLFGGMPSVLPGGGFGYHFDNLLLHITAALFIFAIVKRLRLPGGMLGAWLAATIFAIHPVSVESVAWISERKNCLGGALFFGALYFGFKFFRVFPDQDEERAGAQGLPKPRWGIYGLTLLFFVMSMLSKTTACVAAPVFLLMIWWRRGRISGREIALSLPFWIIGAGLGIFTSFLEKNHVGAVGPEWQFSILQRILIAGTDLWFYIGKLLVPYPVMQIYPRFDINAGQPVTNPVYYLAPVAFFALVVVLYLLRKKITRGPLAAVLFFAGVLSPALGFINFYTMLYTFVADHYQYYACVGIIVLAVETLLWLLRTTAGHLPASDDPQAPARFLRLTQALVPGVIILSLATLAHNVAKLYRNDEALWTFNRDHNPRNFEVWMALAQSRLNAGQTLAAQRQPEEAKKKVREALDALHSAAECAPNDWRPYHGLGTVYLQHNELEKGRQYLLKADELMPAFVRGRRAELYAQKAAAAVDPKNQIGRASVTYGPHFLIAQRYKDNGEYDKAIAEYKLNLEEYPGDLAAYVHMGACYAAKRDYGTAAGLYRHALEKNPNYALAWFQLGVLLLDEKKMAEAEAALNKARELDPVMVEREILAAKALKYKQSKQSP